MRNTSLISVVDCPSDYTSSAVVPGSSAAVGKVNDTLF